MDQPITDSQQKVLIIEDDKLLSDVYLRRLQMEGFDTQSVANGIDASQVAAMYQPDLILLDLMLPGKNGMDVLADLKNSEATKDIKVFVFSAIESDSLVRDHPEEQQRITEAGADKYFVKSRDPLDHVMSEIKEALPNPE